MVFSRMLKIAVYAGVTKVGNDTIWDTDNKYSRMGLKLAKMMSRVLRCKYVISYSVDGEFGRLLADGTWTGMVGMVNRSEVDLAISDIAVTEERSQAVDFSYPLSITEVTFITENPKTSFDLTDALQPFELDVWTVYAILLIIMPIIFYFFLGKQFSFTKIVLQTFGTLLEQHKFQHLRKIYQVLLVSSWMISMTIMGHTYKANLLSMLTVPIFHGVRFIHELSVEVDKGNYDCVSYPGSFYTTFMLGSLDRPRQIIGHNLNKNKGVFDIEEVLERKNTKKIAFIGPKPDLMHLRNKYFISDDIFFTEMAAIAMKKDFSHKKKVNDAIHRVNAGGLYGKLLKNEWLSKVFENFPELAHKHVETVKALSFMEVYSAFMFMLFGHALATICFIIELIMGKKRMAKEKHIKLEKFLRRRATSSAFLKTYHRVVAVHVSELFSNQTD